MMEEPFKCRMCGKLLSDDWIHVKTHAVYVENGKLPLDCLYCTNCFKGLHK